jgi:hypothetical protein
MRRGGAFVAGLMVLAAWPTWAAPSYMITFNNGGAFMPEVYSATAFRRDTSFALAPSNGTGQLTGGAIAGPGFIMVSAQLDCTWGGGFSGSFWGKTRASATAYDFIVTGPAGPSSVPGTLHVRVRVNLDRSGGYPNNGAHNAAFQLNTSTLYSGALGTITYSNSSLSGSGCFAGVSSPFVDVDVPLTGNYPVNVPFSFQMYLEAIPNAYGNAAYNPGLVAITGGGASDDQSGRGVRLDSPVMTLPAGYTLNSVSWGIVNNTYPNIVGVGDESPRRELALEWAGPNPSAGPSRLTLALPRDAHARVAVYDLAGRVVRTLVDGWQSAGVVSLSWDGRSADGRRAGPGLYFVRGVVGGSSVTRSVVRMN